MANHYHLAIVPARVRKPRDKAAVESGVNVINKRVLGYLNEETWTSIAELNEAIRERVHEINHDIRRIDGSTRYERFTAEEHPLLSPLPADGFEEVEWKESKVARNYHVTCDSQHYSVPHEYAGQLLRVRLTSSKVTIFDGQHIVAEHARQRGRKGQYATDPAHVPEQHRNVAGLWSRAWFLDRARAFGPATVTVIGRVLDRREIEAQGYLDCQNILETLGKKDKQRVSSSSIWMGIRRTQR
ncbi:Mu transposase domain-containing protein [Leucobacter sp. W1038]